MTTSTTGRAANLARAILQGAVTLGTLSAMAVWAQNGGKSRRTGRRGSSENEIAEPPPVSDEQRLIEPLGPRVAWGYIEQLDSEYQTTPFELTRQIILLGRQAGCDVLLDDDRASRYHALIMWDHGRGFIQDNGSLNGTILNGQRAVGPVPLRHGDIIEILGINFRFLYSERTGLNVIEAQPTERVPSANVPPANEPPRGNMVMRLTALTGPEPGRSWPIGNSPMLIGRGTESIIMLPHASVSRRHAQIVGQPNGIYVQDLNSSNGTSVNGEPLTAPRRIGNGDHIQVGDVLLVLAIEAAEANAGAAQPTGQGQWTPAPAGPPPSGPSQPPAGWGTPARPQGPGGPPPGWPPATASNPGQAAPPTQGRPPTGPPPGPSPTGWPAPQGAPNQPGWGTSAPNQGGVGSWPAGGNQPAPAGPPTSWPAPGPGGAPPGWTAPGAPNAGPGAPPNQGWPPANGGNPGPAGWPTPNAPNAGPGAPPNQGWPPAGRPPLPNQGGAPTGWPAPQPPGNPPGGWGQNGPAHQGGPNGPSGSGNPNGPGGPGNQGGWPPAGAGQPQGWPPQEAPPEGDGEHRVPRFQPTRPNEH